MSNKLLHRTLRLLAVCSVLLVCVTTQAQTASNLAPGAPGKDAQWESAGKQGVGTSNTLESKVWFTLRDGVMTEVYYPTVDVGNSRLLQFIVVSADGKRVETEQEDATHKIESLDPQSLTFRQTNTAKSGAWTITKTYVNDPARSTVLIDVEFKSKPENRLALYLYYDPSLNNSGMHDSAWTQGSAMLASDADKASALLCAVNTDGRVMSYVQDSTNGYAGTSDGLTQLLANGSLTQPYSRAANGNVVQVMRVNLLVITTGGLESPTPNLKFTVALGFGREADEALHNARSSLAKGFVQARQEYEDGWNGYVQTLRRVEPKYQRQYDMAAMTLRAHEDKTFRGANIASLSVPWGGGASANEPNVGGYHLVWSRDLYHVATAFMALGDKAAADRALNYLFTVQQKPDGSFPQNSWLDGRPFWGSLQMDEVAYPLILAYQLGRTDNATWTKHVRPAANFLISRGPRTDQERWEEKPGYSPSTIAAEIAGLVCAAEIARRNSDEASAAIYLAAADDWARNVEAWTATTTGVYGDKNYYLRITDNNDPNDGAQFDVGNGGGTFDERKIVDAGFLELVRLGIKRADDPLIAKSLKVIDEVIRVQTPHGAAWYRYNNDGYGEMDDGRPWNFDGKYTGKGRLWALLTGERGQYELARYRFEMDAEIRKNGEGSRSASAHANLESARGRLAAMMGMANEGLMIPEQVWDKPASPARPRFEFGEGTGSATPLAWSMAQFIRLATNLAEGRNMDTPDIVRKRYVENTPPAQASYDIGEGLSEAALQRLDRSERNQPLRFTFRAVAGARLFAMVNGEPREIPLDKTGEGELRLERLTGDALVFALQSPTGATVFTRLDVRAANASPQSATTDAPDKMNKVIEQLKSATTSPVIIEDTAYFIYRGAAKDVQLVGDMTGWRPRGLRFVGVDGTNTKFYAQTFAKDARVEYKLIADGEWINDPLNEDKIDNGVGGENSVFAMPNYRGAFIKGVSEWTQRVRSSSFIPAEEEINVPSRILGGTRRVKVWADSWQRERSDKPLPVLYVQDGSDYLVRALAHFAAKRSADGEMVMPFMIVAVDPADRMKEYWANDRFADFMATELVPFIDKNYRTISTRDARALMGASLGGVISVWTYLRHPDVFSRVAGQSTAFWIDDERVVSALNRLPVADPRKPVHFYFDVGRMESILDVNRRVQTSLRAKGYAVTYREAETGHNWTSWRDRLADAYTGIWKD